MSLQDEYNDIVANLHELCRGKNTCKECHGVGGFDGIGPDAQDPPGPACSACKGRGFIINPCGGFIVTDLDTVHACPYHYVGQTHPEEDGPEMSQEQFMALCKEWRAKALIKQEEVLNPPTQDSRGASSKEDFGSDRDREAVQDWPPPSDDDVPF